MCTVKLPAAHCQTFPVELAKRTRNPLHTILDIQISDSPRKLVKKSSLPLVKVTIFQKLFNIMQIKAHHDKTHISCLF